MQVVDRKIQRSFLKKYQGNNKINKAWRDFQIKKYGLQQYVDMYNKNCGKHKAKRITPSTAYKV